MKIVRALSWPLAIAIFVALLWHEGVRDVMQPLSEAGAALLWLVPLHLVPLVFDAQGWRVLLGGRASLPFLTWVATVREAVGRMLPSAGIGGELVGIRLGLWRVDDSSLVAASVVVEVLTTIAVQYAFSALGIVLIFAQARHGGSLTPIVVGLVLSLPIPVICGVLLRRGGLFDKLDRFAKRLFGADHRLLAGVDGAALDTRIDALLTQPRLLGAAFAWQLAGYVIGALETYWALALLGHPISLGAALAIEALTQAVRHAAFIVPAGLGIQEAALVVLGQMLGVDAATALSLALTKRMREVVFCGIALASWQIVESWRAHRTLGWQLRRRLHIRRRLRLRAQRNATLPTRVAFVTHASTGRGMSSRHDGHRAQAGRGASEQGSRITS
jgi:putative membrane protein